LTLLLNENLKDQVKQAKEEANLAKEEANLAKVAKEEKEEEWKKKNPKIN